jgi:hypothetical protein
VVLNVLFIVIVALLTVDASGIFSRSTGDTWEKKAWAHLPDLHRLSL